MKQHQDQKICSFTTTSTYAGCLSHNLIITNEYYIHPLTSILQPKCNHLNSYTQNTSTQSNQLVFAKLKRNENLYNGKVQYIYLLKVF